MPEEMLTWDCKERLVSNLKNNPKGYLEYQKIIIGSWITIGDPSVAEIMAKGEFDWLAANIQHNTIEQH